MIKGIYLFIEPSEGKPRRKGVYAMYHCVQGSLRQLDHEEHTTIVYGTTSTMSFHIPGALLTT